MVKKPISRDAFRTSSASASLSSRRSLYMRDTSMRGIESDVVAALDFTTNDLPLDNVICLGLSVCKVVDVVVVVAIAAE
jgi:hypothetical protein